MQTITQTYIQKEEKGWTKFGGRPNTSDGFFPLSKIGLFILLDGHSGGVGGTRSLFTKWGMGFTLRILFPVYSPLLLFFSPLIIMSNFSLHIKLIIFFSSFHGLLASLSISFFYFVCLVLCFLFFFQGIERNVVDGCWSWIVFLNHCGGFRSRRDGWFSTIVNRMPSM